MNELAASLDGLVPLLGELALAALAGSALGAIFFGGLWWTARRGAASPRPALWFFTSMLARMGIALSGIYAVADGRWQRILACLLGFIVARTYVVYWTRPQGGTRAPETRHAP